MDRSLSSIEAIRREAGPNSIADDRMNSSVEREPIAMSREPTGDQMPELVACALAMPLRGSPSYMRTAMIEYTFSHWQRAYIGL
jgi:hypothetical protein